MRELLDRHLGEGWMDRAVEPVHLGRASREIPDADLWAARSAQRRELIELVRARSVTERLRAATRPSTCAPRSTRSTPTC